jgi:hypothetical protein
MDRDYLSTKYGLILKKGDNTFMLTVLAWSRIFTQYAFKIIGPHVANKVTILPWPDKLTTLSGSDLCIPRNETARPCYFQNRIIMFSHPVSTFMHL